MLQLLFPGSVKIAGDHTALRKLLHSHLIKSNSIDLPQRAGTYLRTIYNFNKFNDY